MRHLLSVIHEKCARTRGSVSRAFAITISARSASRHRRGRERIQSLSHVVSLRSFLWQVRLAPRMRKERKCSALRS